MKHFKKTFRIVAILSIIPTILAGCNSALNSAKATLDSDTTLYQTTTPLTGGVVRASLSSEPDNLDPHLSAAADTEAMMNNVFEGLVGFTPEGEFIPRIAKSFDISEDGLNYTFVIRTDVTFHNGKLLTVDDVIYSYSRLAGLNGKKPLSSKFANVTQIKKINETTVCFVLSQRSASFLSACTEAVIPAKYTEQSSKPIGTGPFTFVDYIPGQKLILNANTHYYDLERKPYIDSIEFHFTKDATSTLLAFKAGDLDLAEIDYTNALTLGDNYNLFSNPQNMVQIMALNHEVAPFDDIRVRQAINHAIDKDIIVNAVANGFATKLYTTASPVMEFWYNDLSSNDPYPYDPEIAKALLAEAGYPAGFTTTIKVPANYPFHIDTAQVIADMLANIGITLNIELIEWGQWLDTVYTNADYETTIIGLAGKLEPHEIFVRFESTYPKNFYRFKNDTYDMLIAEANLEIDNTRRAELYQKAQKLVTDEAAAVFLTDPHLVRATRSDLLGYTAYPAPYFDATTLYYVGKQ